MIIEHVPDRDLDPPEPMPERGEESYEEAAQRDIDERIERLERYKRLKNKEKARGITDDVIQTIKDIVG